MLHDPYPDLLAVAEERSLARAVQAGHPQAREALILRNLRLVSSIAKSYATPTLERDDLEHEGVLGLIRAVEDYDPEVGTKFSTYARYWIIQSVRAYVLRHGSPLRLPQHMATTLVKWDRIARDLEAGGEAATPDRIAARLGLTAKRRAVVTQALVARSRFDATRLHDEVGLGRHPEDHDAAREREWAESAAEVGRSVAAMPEPARTVLTLRFGLGGIPPHTLRQAGARLGRTGEWARIVEAGALQSLRTRSEP